MSVYFIDIAPPMCVTGVFSIATGLTHSFLVPPIGTQIAYTEDGEVVLEEDQMETDDQVTRYSIPRLAAAFRSYLQQFHQPLSSFFTYFQVPVFSNH